MGSVPSSAVCRVLRPVKGPPSVLALPGDRRAVELGEPAVPALQRAPDQHAGRPDSLLRSAVAFRPKHAGGRGFLF